MLATISQAHQAQFIAARENLGWRMYGELPERSNGQTWRVCVSENCIEGEDVPKDVRKTFRDTFASENEAKYPEGVQFL